MVLSALPTRLRKRCPPDRRIFVVFIVQVGNNLRIALDSLKVVL